MIAVSRRPRDVVDPPLEMIATLATVNRILRELEAEYQWAYGSAYGLAARVDGRSSRSVSSPVESAVEEGPRANAAQACRYVTRTVRAAHDMLASALVSLENATGGRLRWHDRAKSPTDAPDLRETLEKMEDAIRLAEAKEARQRRGEGYGER